MDSTKKCSISPLNNAQSNIFLQHRVHYDEVFKVFAECAYCGDDITTRNCRQRTLKSGEVQTACSNACALSLGGEGWRMTPLHAEIKKPFDA